MLRYSIRVSEGRERQRNPAMVAFLLGTTAILVVGLILRLAVDDLVSRWIKGRLDIPHSLPGVLTNGVR
jgi:hypothetical protein